MAPRSRKTLPCTYSQRRENKALDAEPPVASFLKSMLIGGGPVNAIVRLPIRRTRDVTRHPSNLHRRIPSCSSCPSWFPVFFTATVTRPQVLRPRSPARRADSPSPMNSLPDVAYVPASSRKAPTGAGGPLDAEIVIRDQRFDIGRRSGYDSRLGDGEPNAASDRTRRPTNFPVNRNGRQHGL